MDELVQAFSKNYLTKSQAGPRRKIGIELEFPIVDDCGEAVSYSVLKEMFTWLGAKGWNIKLDGGTGEKVEAKKSLTSGTGRFNYDEDTIGTDVGYCTLETSLCPEDDLFAMEVHWKKLKGLLLEYFDQAGCHLLGYGIQPISYPSSKLIANKGRYRFFEEDSLNRYVDQRQGRDVSAFAITAANQCHIDIYQEEAILAVNVLNGLAPLLSAVTANASVWRGSVDSEWADVREVLWDKCWSNRIEQTGIPDPFKDFGDYVDRLCQFRPLMVVRDGECVKVMDHKTFGDFIFDTHNSKGRTVDGKSVKLLPSADDIRFQSGFAWWEARLAPNYGTIEIRPCSQQPEEAVLCVAAFALGLVENLDAAYELYTEYTLSDWRRLRFDVLRHGLGALARNDHPVVSLVERALRLARAGLRKRGLGEEIFLNVLDKRVASNLTISDKVREVFNKDNLQPFFDMVEVRKDYKLLASQYTLDRSLLP
ncbi:MAG TPA: glutamate-cysteine ligase family protein [Verrucomicrobiae bacterium]|nr:glutamate-cysteine ligase family protein [Verrucomicrobiae bacterium]